MASNKTITTVIFDLGQVIVTFDHMQLCQRAAACCPHAPEEIFTRMFHSGLVHRFETGTMNPNEFYREVSRTLDMQLPCEQFKTVWNTIFTLNTDTVRIIESLSGYKRLLLSNTNCWHFDYCLESYPVLNIFDDWILSYEVGACKPDKKIFETALARTAVRPQECVFIDDIEQYTDAARSLGISAHTFTNAKGLEQFLNSLNML